MERVLVLKEFVIVSTDSFLLCERSGNSLLSDIAVISNLGKKLVLRLECAKTL